MKLTYFWRIVIVLILLLVTVLIRTYRLREPLGDWHSWRQADTAAVTRNFIQEDFNMFYPRSDSLWSLSESQLPNPNRYFMNEFPFYNAIVALVYSYTGIDHVYGRMVSIGFAAIGALALYGIVATVIGYRQAIATLTIYALLPYNIYYGRVFMPDPAFVSLSIISLYWCVKYVASNKLIHGMLMGIFLALAMLVKPYAIFMTIPIIYWIMLNHGMSAFRSVRNYLFALIAFTPLVLWRYHLSLHPEASFASSWLLNGDGIRFKGAFFRWIIFDRLNRLIFATGGFVLFFVGLLKSYMKKNTSLFFVWTLAIFAYITVFAKGNVNHDYYQLPIVAPGVVLIVIGAEWLIKSSKVRWHQFINSLIVLSLVSCMLAFGWFEVRGFFNINNRAMIDAGIRADQILPKDAIVIAPYNGDPAFLYQTNRNGWPVGGNIDERIRDGAQYYITTSFDDEFNTLKNMYTLIEENDRYAIIKLVK